MPRRPHKFRLLLDENMELKSFFQRVNNFHNVKHIVRDYKKAGLKDADVFKLAKHEKRILITYNFKDFRNFTLTQDVGIIGISRSLLFSEIDKKLMSFLRDKSETDLYGKKYFISGESQAEI